MWFNEKAYKDFSKVVREAGEKVHKILVKHPSPLEKKMKRLLNENNVDFLFHTVMHKELNGKRCFAEAFYIPSFYFPQKKIAIEMEDSIGNKRSISNRDRDYIASVDELRIYDIHEFSKKIQVLKITEEDFKYPSFTQELLSLLKN